MKKIINNFIKFLDRLFIASKKIIRSNDNRYGLRALATLFVFVYVIGQGIKEFFFKNKLTASILIFFLVAYITSHFDEHVVLTIAMLLCLYFSYDVLTSLIKNEIKSRNDQIYREFINNTKEQVNVLNKKRLMIKNLETFTTKIEQIKNSSVFGKNKNNLDFFDFKPTVDLKKNLETMVYEELYYLDSVYRAKSNVFQKTAIASDKDLEFTVSKIEEINN